MNELVALNIPGDNAEYSEEELNEMELELLAEKKEIEGRVEDLREQSENIKQNLRSFTSDMESRYPLEVQQLDALKQELDELLDSSDTPLDFESIVKNDMFRENYERTKILNERLSKNNNKAKSDGIKRLFKIIAAKTHPDKTNKPGLIKLFYLAREAYDKNNYERMERIFKCLALKTTWAVFTLQEEIKDLRITEAYNVEEIQKLAESDLFKPMLDYTSGLYFLKQRAADYFLQKLNREINKLRNEIHDLKNPNESDPIDVEQPNSNKHYFFHDMIEHLNRSLENF